MAGEAAGAAGFEGLAQGLAHGDAVGQGPAVAGGRVGLVGQDDPVACGGARQIAGIELHVAPRPMGPAHAGAEEVRVAVDQTRRDHAAADQVLGAVDVGQEGFDQARPLDQAGLDAAPFVRGHDHRQRVEPPGMGAVVRVGIDVERDAAFLQQAPRRPVETAEAFFVHAGEPGHQRPPGRPDQAVRADHLVEHARLGPIGRAAPSLAAGAGGCRSSCRCRCHGARSGPFLPYRSTSHPRRCRPRQARIPASPGRATP